MTVILLFFTSRTVVTSCEHLRLDAIIVNDNHCASFLRAHWMCLISTLSSRRTALETVGRASVFV